MATNFNDALQLYNVGSSSIINNTNDGITIPEGSETLSDLVKLYYNFPIEPNNPVPSSYNIYIWNNNADGEIRFHTLNAKDYNDYNQDYISGIYSGLRLEHNTKIGKDGHLYYWHNFTIVNPTKLSGWYKIDDNFNSVESQLILLDVSVGANSILIANLLQAVADIIIVDNTQTGQITTLFTNIGIIETRLTNLEGDNLVGEFAGYSPVAADTEAIAQASTQRREVERLITQEASLARQTALREVNSKYGSVISSFINKAVQVIGGLALLAAVYAAIRTISDNQTKKIYEDEMVAITNSLSIIPVSLSNNTINHTRLSIVSGNGGFTASTKEFIIPIQRNAVLRIGINSSLNAYIIVVDKPGDTYFTVNENITINKNLINGGIGNLVINVNSLGTLKEWTELKNAYLINKINKINTKNRRKNYVIGHDDVNTEQFINVDASYIDYDEEGQETINYKILKSRINLLPAGTNDIDLYTLTGKVGIGTATPTNKLHIYDDVNNDTKLVIQNNTIIAAGTLPTEISVIGATSTTIGTTDRIIMFPYTGSDNTKNYSFTTTQNLICDILIVGGGGGGGAGHGGGGGAGQLILIHQATLNGTYTIKVGNGGNGAILSGSSLTSAATKGINSEFGNASINVIADGGGANGDSTLKDGGSGSGGDGYTPDSGVAGKGLKNTTIDTFSSGIVYNRGNDGGNGNNTGGGGQGGGGGGAGAAGTTGGSSVNTTIGHGGDGLSGISEISYDFKTNFGNYGKLETDGNYWFAGGGAGGIYYTTAGVVSNGGKGGGGSTPPCINGVAQTGGIGVNGTGSGGAGGSAHYGSGGKGGSGIVIIKYRLLSSTSSSLELVRGTTIDSSVDYSVGNYDGSFKIKSVDSGTPTDRMIINSTGFVGIGTDPSSVHKLYVNGNILADRFIGFNVNVGKLSNIELNVYKATNPTLRIESDAGGTPILEFMRGTNTDINKDYRFISESDILKLQFQDNTTLYGADTNQLLWIDNAKTIIHKPIECKSNVGIGTEAHATYKLDVNGNSRLTGNVGIDTTPHATYKLDVNGNSRLTGNVGIATIPHATYILDVAGDTRLTGNIGVNTAPQSTHNLYIYNALTANIRLESSADQNSTTSIEFRKGSTLDVWTDYKIINDNGSFKLQYENASFPYGDAVNDIVKWTGLEITNYKPTRFNDTIGIGTDAIITYKLDILGDARITGVLNSVGTINSTNYAVGGLDIFNAETKKILPERIDMSVVDLNINKLYEKFNQTNFAIVDNKIDLPAQYSINITGYDSPTLYIPNDPRRLKGKMNVSYDDRQGLYKLEATNITKIDNVAVLKYKVGDKISIRNTAEPAKDFFLYDGFKYFMSVILVKRPSNRPLDHYVDDVYSTLLFEWKSSDGLEGRVPAFVRDTRPNPDIDYPFTTIMTFVVEAGFNYYLYKLWAQTEVSGGGIIYVDLRGYGDDYDDFNRVYGAGQTFKLRSDYEFTVNDYTPRNYTAAQAGIALQNTPGLTKPRRGIALDDEGGLSAVPLSADLITNMNTSHFTNNTGTNKIDISSTYVAPKATKLETARTIGGTSFDGSADIAVNLAAKATKLETARSIGGTSFDGSADIAVNLAAKATKLETARTIGGTSFDGSANISVGLADTATKLATARTIGGTSFDGSANIAVSLADTATKLATTRAIAGVNFDGSAAINIPYFNLTFKPTAGTGIDITTGDASTSPVISATYTSTNLITIFNATQFEDLTSKVSIKTTWKPTTAGAADTATKLATARTIGGTSFDGSANIAVGLADTATKLATARTIGGTSFDGSANIAVGLADTATKLATARTIGGTSFDGSANIAVGLADTATKLATTRAIAGVNFDGSAAIAIPYFNLSNKLTAGTGIDITPGDASTSPIISSTSSFTPTSTNLISVFNSTQFENVASVIQIKSSIIPPVLTAGKGIYFNPTNTINSLWQYPDVYTTPCINTADRVRIGSLTESSALLHLTGSATNGGTLRLEHIGNTPNIEILRATGTASANYNWNILNDNSLKLQSKNLALAYTDKLEISGAGDVGIGTVATTTYKLDVNGNIRGYGIFPNFIDCSTTLRGEELQVFGYGLVVVGNSSTLMRISNNINNELRVQQTLVAANDVKFSIFQRDNNVEYATPSITFYKGKIGIGTTTPATYPLTVGGDINITGNYRINGAILDYFVLNNKPIILQPTTTNLQLVSGYTFSIPGNVGVGTTAIATNVLQVGAGGRLRISNGATDYTLLGTIDADGATNTSIVLSGNTRSTNAGNIQYLATASGGSHIFYTASATTRMTINSAGVNVNNDLGVSGNVGVGVAPATYKLNVAGDINCTGAFRINGTALSTGSRWSVGAVATNIFYNSGNVGIGTSTLSSDDGNTAFALPDAVFYVKSPNTTGGTCDVVFRGGNAGQAGGKTKLWLASDAGHSSYIQSEHPGNGITHLSFGTATGNVLPTEKMRIYSSGAIGLQGVGNWGIAQGMTAGSVAIGNIGQNYGGQSGAVANMAGLMMECSDNTEIAVHDSNTAVYSFMYYTTNGNFRIGRNMGWGVSNLYITGPLFCNSYIECDASILSKNVIYARNSYDTRMRSDAGGMFFECGDIGNNNYLQFGAFNGMTAIDSGAGRMLRMRIGTGLSWEFNTNSTTWNAKGSTTWDAPSDHRIKEDIKKANLKICYNNVKNINLYRFKYIDGFKEATKQDRTQLGYIAQQVKQHFPKSVQRSKTRIEDKREIPDLASVDISQVNFTLFGAVKQLMRIVEKQSKRIKKLEEMLNIIDDDEVEDDADEPYTRINCEDEVDIDEIEPSESTEV